MERCSRTVGALACALLLLLSGFACGQPEAVRETLDSTPPTGPGAFAPRLAPAPGGVWMTWLEPGSDSEKPTHRLRVARFTDAGWSEPATIFEGSDFFANWADFPQIAENPSGRLLVSWLEKTGEETYAYGIRLAHSTDHGATWQPLGFLHDDATPTEHGFVSLVPERDGFRALWLDGREMMEGGPMALRSAFVGETVGPSRVVDPRVCECCTTSAVATRRGALVAYRNRTEDEIRDIYTARREDGGWTEPARVHADRWVIPGCPVNGPALAASGDRVAAAWFTAADGEPKVQVAFSEDSGATFGPPVLLQGEGALGRVDVVLGDAGSALVSWLASEEGQGVIRLGHVDSKGVLAEPISLARTTAGRAAGFPQIELWDDRVFAAWVEEDDDPETPSEIRFREVSYPHPSGS